MKLVRTVAAWPPGHFLAALVAAVSLDELWPLPVIAGPGVRYASGAILMTLGLTGLIWCLRLFRQAGTPVAPGGLPAVLIASGPYRLSRNPIYLSDGLITAGMGLLLGTLWAIPLAVLAILSVDQTIVRGEEKRLEQLFESDWERYRSRVRRWL